jgi:DNA polymerase III epsilon subunit-like protein
LCAIYDIELEDHHRALCDARAAARLLNLINKERDDGLSAEGVAGRFSPGTSVIRAERTKFLAAPDFRF